MLWTVSASRTVMGRDYEIEGLLEALSPRTAALAFLHDVHTLGLVVDYVTVLGDGAVHLFKVSGNLLSEEL